MKRSRIGSIILLISLAGFFGCQKANIDSVPIGGIASTQGVETENAQFPFVRSFRLLFQKSAPDHVEPRTTLRPKEIEELQDNVQFWSLDEDLAENDPKRVLLTNTNKVVVQTSRDGTVTVDAAAIAAIVEYLCLKYVDGLSKCSVLIENVARADFNKQQSYTFEQTSQFNLTNMPPMFRYMHMEYELAGAVRYLLYHERAHRMLGHLEKVAKASPRDRCSIIQIVELEADDFATKDAMKLINNPFLMFLKVGDPFSAAIFEGMTGYLVVLDKVKGLHSGSNALLNCSYPSREARLARAKSIVASQRRSLPSPSNDPLQFLKALQKP